MTMTTMKFLPITVIVLLLLVIGSKVTNGWMTGTSSRVSSFGGSVLITGVKPVEDTTQYRQQHDITMKKGKDNVPPTMRTQYKKQKEMVAMRDQMLAATKPGADGFPIFNLFVRTKRANLWYPCGSFKGDDRSMALAKNYADDNLLAGISKKQIDQGIASSLYRDQSKLKESIVRAYPQLRPSMDEFEFGYKLAFDGLTKEQLDEIKPIVPAENKGIFDNIKNTFFGGSSS